jgi:L-ascorbate metabolism protein UlaG (beta-lactamase superfamily)
MSAAMQPLSVTWLGHGTFYLVSPGGQRILIDPFLADNPSCPVERKRPEQLGGVDVVLVTHGHFDHVGDLLAVAQALRPQIVANYEICTWLEQKGIANTRAMNKGGTQVIDGIAVTMVHAVHSSSIVSDGDIFDGGEPCGYVLRFENGFTLYHAGDTDVFSDMRLIGELYRPDLAHLPIGDLFTMSPRQAAHAIRLLGVRRVIPMHYGTWPPLTGTPAQLREQARDVEGLEIVELKPGETWRAG